MSALWNAVPMFDLPTWIGTLYHQSWADQYNPNEALQKDYMMHMKTDESWWEKRSRFITWRLNCVLILSVMFNPFECFMNIAELWCPIAELWFVWNVESGFHRHQKDLQGLCHEKLQTEHQAQIDVLLCQEHVWDESLNPSAFSQ